MEKYLLIGGFSTTNVKQGGDAIGKELIGKDPIGKKSVERDPIGKKSVERDPIGKKLAERDPIGKKSVERDPIGKKSVERDPIGDSLYMASVKKPAVYQAWWNRSLWVMDQSNFAYSMIGQRGGQIQEIQNINVGVDFPFFTAVCGKTEQYHLHSADKKTAIRLNLNGKTLKITLEKIEKSVAAKKGIAMSVHISDDYQKPSSNKSTEFLLKKSKVFNNLSYLSGVSIILLKKLG